METGHEGVQDAWADRASTHLVDSRGQLGTLESLGGAGDDKVRHGVAGQRRELGGEEGVVEGAEGGRGGVGGGGLEDMRGDRVAEGRLDNSRWEREDAVGEGGCRCVRNDEVQNGR